MSDTTIPDPVTTRSPIAPNDAAITACRDLLRDSIARIETESARIFADWEPQIARAEFRTGAENLAFYLAARQYDLTGLQSSLSVLGLSSLGRARIPSPPVAGGGRSDTRRPLGIAGKLA